MFFYDQFLEILVPLQFKKLFSLFPNTETQSN